MKTNYIKIISIVLLSVYLYSVDATLNIVKKSHSKPLVYAIDFSNALLDVKTKRRISKLIIGDGLVSGHMRIVKYSNKRLSFKLRPNYKKFSKLGVDILLYYRVYRNARGLDLQVKAYDVNTGSISYIKTYKTLKRKRYPFLVHKMTIDLNTELGAPDISWMENLVIFSRVINSKGSDIVVADYTLTYQKTIVKGGRNIFPKWANKKQTSFYYTNISGNKKPRIYKAGLLNSDKEFIIASDGMAVVSDVGENDNQILLTLALKGQAEIYMYNIKSKRLKQITKNNSIDVSGSFIKNDSSIAFVSDRLGAPNIFQKSIYGDEVEQLVYHGTNNNSCNTHGDKVVFVSRDKARERQFNLYLISVNNDYIRKLTSSGVNQFPKFSNDGDSILFIKHYKYQSSVGIIRLKYDQVYLFPLRAGKIQSIDW